MAVAELTVRTEPYRGPFIVDRVGTTSYVRFASTRQMQHASRRSIEIPQVDDSGCPCPERHQRAHSGPPTVGLVSHRGGWKHSIVNQKSNVKQIEARTLKFEGASSCTEHSRRLH